MWNAREPLKHAYLKNKAAFIKHSSFNFYLPLLRQISIFDNKQKSCIMEVFSYMCPKSSDDP